MPVAAVLVAMVCFQVGAATAKQLFPLVGAAGTTALRLGIASLIMLAVFRPWRLRLGAGQARILVGYGLAMGWMNFLFYMSLSRIPLGIAVALEFTGPLAVAMAASRRAIDFLWIALAALGLTALLPLGHPTQPLNATGIVFALGAAVCWAMYIIFGQRMTNAHSGQTATLGTMIGAVCIVPVGAWHAGWTLLSPSVLPAAIAVAVLSSALPYTLEMYALSRVPARTFGVLMSLDPALAALSGLSFLGETLSIVQWSAIASIIVASAGSAITGRAGMQSPLTD
jgi:inner membrane transporter RhtA